MRRCPESDVHHLDGGVDLSVETTGGGRINVRASTCLCLFMGRRAGFDECFYGRVRVFTVRFHHRLLFSSFSFSVPANVSRTSPPHCTPRATRERRYSPPETRIRSAVVRRRHDGGDLRNPFPDYDGRDRAIVLAVPAVEKPDCRYHGRSELPEGHRKPLQRSAYRHGRRAAGRRFVGGVL